MPGLERARGDGAAKRTFCAVIADPCAAAVLSPWGALFGRAKHWAFREIHVRGRRTSDVKREALRRFGITARQFNGVRFDLDQEVNAWRGTLRHRKARLEDRIEAVAETIARLDRKIAGEGRAWKRRSLRLHRHGKARHLGGLRDSLAKVEADLAGDVPRLCFGGRAALRRGDLDEWRARRGARILLVGAACEAGGNQTVRWADGVLILRLPDALGGGTATLQGVRFRYGEDALKAAYERGTGIAWLLFEDERGRWRAHVTIDEPAADPVTDARHGTIGVDRNVDHLAIVFVDRMGNPVRRATLPFPEAGTEAGKAAAMVGEAVAALCGWARDTGYSIAVEALDFGRKKAALKAYGKRHARRLSGFAYAKFDAMLDGKAARAGVEVLRVNPAFTSVIGRMKYARGRAMGAHHAAALVIGRRAMGFGERFVCMDGTALDGPGRNRSRHRWSRWRGARRRLAREGAAASVRGDARASSARTARSVVGTRRTGAPHGGPPPRTGCRGGARTPTGPPQAGAAVGPAKR